MLVGGDNDWRIRVGDYRVIYQIADSVRIVRINRVRHRARFIPISQLLRHHPKFRNGKSRSSRNSVLARPKSGLN